MGEPKESKSRKRKRNKEKKHKKSGKKSKKKRKKRSRSSSSSEGEMWVEVTKNSLANKGGSSDEEVVGPLPVQEDMETEKGKFVNYGKDLLPGEGAAMAAFVADGKRIPRRGEIGLQTADIEKFEDAGFVMSGTRHKRMEATRMRKENQIYSTEEKRMLSNFSHEERHKKEQFILSQFRELVDQKTKKNQ